MVIFEKVTKVESLFAGILESIEDAWEIGGVSVSVSDQTDSDDDSIFGDSVEVTFITAHFIVVEYHLYLPIIFKGP